MFNNYSFIETLIATSLRRGFQTKQNASQGIDVNIGHFISLQINDVPDLRRKPGSLGGVSL